MRFSSSLALGALVAGQACAASISHASGKQHNHAARHAEIQKAHQHREWRREDVQKRDASAINAADTNLLNSLSVMIGSNSYTSNGLNAWLGSDGKFTNEFINQSGEDLVLTVWGPWGSWVNANKPHITVSIPKNGTQTVSFPIGWSGAWAPIYKNTKTVNGQVFETWGEATFAPPYSVVDVSREVNLGGRNMAIHGPTCLTDMNTCVFKCAGGANTCTYDYELVNCATGSQPGANYGTFAGAPSGGCGGMGSSANLKTYLG